MTPTHVVPSALCCSEKAATFELEPAATHNFSWGEYLTLYTVPVPSALVTAAQVMPS